MQQLDEATVEEQTNDYELPSVDLLQVVEDAVVAARVGEEEAAETSLVAVAGKLPWPPPLLPLQVNDQWLGAFWKSPC